MTTYRRKLAYLVSLAGFAVVSGCGNDNIDSVTVRTWDTEKDAASFPPELNDPELAVSDLRERPSFGIAFSGGGSRSASASLGELRALNTLGWLRRARYISANSGGSWAAVPYTYLPNNIDERRFLGEYLQPQDFSDDTLKPAESDPHALGTAIHNASTIDELLSVYRGDEGYSNIVGSIFLDPFDIHENERFFTFRRNTLESIVSANPHLTDNDFLIVERNNRPYLIVVGTMLAEQRSEDPGDYFLLEMTPLYTGIRRRFEFEKDGETVVVGGGYVESYGYDSYEPQSHRNDGRWKVGLSGLLARGDRPLTDRYRFTLSDVIGISSSAPLATLSRYSVPNFIFPELKHWPIDQEAIARAGSNVRQTADEFQHGDGADIDNLAVMPLFIRQVENILVFINTSKAFSAPEGGCESISDDHVTDDLVSLFRKNQRLIHNVVIENGDEELKGLCEQFVTRQNEGQPLTYCQAYNVTDNPRHGIEHYRASVCWVYLDRTREWVEKIDRNNGRLNRALRNRESPFDTFPHYTTFAEQGASVIDLDRERVSALSNLTAWTVFESADYVRQSFGAIALP